MPRSAFTPPPRPQPSNTPSIAPQIEAQRPIQPAGGGISTWFFLFVILTLGWMGYNLAKGPVDTDEPQNPGYGEVDYGPEDVVDDLNWEATP
jgi:hypothetical protein